MVATAMLLNSGNAASPGQVYTLSGVLPSASQLLFVFVAARDSNSSNRQISGVTWKGESLTQVVGSVVESSPMRGSWWVFEGDVPVDPSDEVTVTFVGAAGPAWAVISAVGVSDFVEGDEIDSVATDVDLNTENPDITITTTEDNTLVLAGHYTNSATEHTGFSGTSLWIEDLTAANYCSGQFDEKEVAGDLTLSLESGLGNTISSAISINSAPIAEGDWFLLLG